MEKTTIQVLKKTLEIKMIAIEAFAYGECMGAELNQWYCKLYTECQKTIEAISAEHFYKELIKEALTSLIETESNPPLHGGMIDPILKKCLEDLELS